MAILDNVVEKLLTRTEFLSTEIKDWSKADGVFILDGAVGPTGTAIVNSIVLASSRVGDGVGIPEGFNEKVGVRLSVGATDGIVVGVRVGNNVGKGVGGAVIEKLPAVISWNSKLQ